MTGAIAAAQYPDGTIKLKYEDGTLEAAAFDDPPELDELQANWFELVGKVQEQARRLNPAAVLG